MGGPMTPGIDMTPAEWAMVYRSRGWSPIPIPYKSKVPKITEWQNLRLTDADIPHYFNGELQNISVLQGDPSGGLVDIDLDAPEAVQLADHFLPATSCIFGRVGKPCSHRLYVATSTDSTTQYEDVDGTMLVEYRSTGAQTVFPASVHPSGEAVEWEQFDEPARLDGRSLKAGVARLAGAALIARYWPKEGSPPRP